MTVLYVVGSLLALLAVACWWEARSGKPAWNVHPGASASAPTTRDASKAAKGGVAATLGAAGLVMGGDGDG